MNAVVVVIVAVAGARGRRSPPAGSLPPHGAPAAARPPAARRRILLPFTGQAISRRAFDAAVRLARAEDATIMPAFLARVPRHLAARRAAARAVPCGMPLLEAIEQRARSAGRRRRRAHQPRAHLPRRAAPPARRGAASTASSCRPTANPRNGLTGDDLEWLLEQVPAEVLILRPAPEDHRKVTAEGVKGHF